MAVVVPVQAKTVVGGIPVPMAIDRVDLAVCKTNHSDCAACSHASTLSRKGEKEELPKPVPAGTLPSSSAHGAVQEAGLVRPKADASGVASIRIASNP